MTHHHHRVPFNQLLQIANHTAIVVPLRTRQYGLWCCTVTGHSSCAICRVFAIVLIIIVVIVIIIVNVIRVVVTQRIDNGNTVADGG